MFQSPSRWGRCCFRPCKPVDLQLLVGFSPLLDGDGVASALELPHSTPLLGGLRSHFCADGISAPKHARSANSIVTIHLHNSLRTRIPHTVSLPPWAPANFQSR